MGDHETSTVHLTVPARSAFLSLLRVTAAAVAAPVASDVRVLDDVRLAVDELAARAIAGAPPHRHLRMELRVDASMLVVSGRVEADGDPPALSTAGELLVSSTCDHHRLGREGHDITFDLWVALDADRDARSGGMDDRAGEGE